MKPAFIREGTTDEVLQCECCGNTDLTYTVAVRHVDSGEVFYFGSVCAAKATHPWARLVGKYATWDLADAEAATGE